MQSLASTSILINAPKYRTSHRQDAGIGVGVKAARAALKSFPTERFSMCGSACATAMMR